MANKEATAQLTGDQHIDDTHLEYQDDTARANELAIELGRIANELGEIFGMLSNPARVTRDAAHAVDRQLATNRQAVLNRQHSATIAPEPRLDVRKRPTIR
ncbi:hypothetical protein IPM09_02155 [Candidatus Saccharibacteria bacterium]|nr:MAG: hypothetical protein IPM09_02155 [Candidatus Saccharibacteria bacterium]